MGDRIAVLAGGVLQQLATPQDLYRSPANTFVAGFLGAPPMSLVPATVRPDGPGPGLVTSGGALALAPGTLPPGTSPGQAVLAGLRAEDLSILSADRQAGPGGGLALTVTIVELLGADALVVGRLADGTAVTVRQPAHLACPAAGQVVTLDTSRAPVHLFDAATGTRLGTGTMAGPGGPP